MIFAIIIIYRQIEDLKVMIFFMIKKFQLYKNISPILNNFQNELYNLILYLKF